MGIGIERGSIEANMRNRIYLENRIVGIFVPWDKDIWLVITRCTLMSLCRVRSRA